MAIVIVYILWILFALALAKYSLPVYLIGCIGGFIGVTIYAFFHNRMMAYVEDHIYGGKWDEYMSKEEYENIVQLYIIHLILLFLRSSLVNNQRACSGHRYTAS